MVANPLAAMFWLMLRRRVSCCGKGAAKNESQRFKILQVWWYYIHVLRQISDWILDMPEAEATYIITNGGINDPDGAKA